MKTDNDIVALMELLKMAAAHWPHSRTEVSQSDLFCRDQTLLGNVAGSLPTHRRRGA